MTTWLAMGCLIGLAIGYFGYVRQTPTFESSARIQIRYAESNLSQPQESFDESATLVGQPTVAKAVREHRLERLDELQSAGSNADPDIAISMLLSKGQLSAQRIATILNGSIYEITYRSTTPSSSRKVVDAMIDACESTMPESGDREAWDESIRLLDQARQQVAMRTEGLTNQLDQVETSLDAVLRGGELISSAAQRWKTLQLDIDAKHATLAGLRKRIESVQMLIAQDASPESIVQQLEQPITRRIEAPTTVSGAAGDMPIDPQQRQQESIELKRKVDQELVPLEAERSKLLERYGASHPTVVAVQRKIDAVKSKLGIVEHQVSPIANASIQVLRTGTKAERRDAIDSLLQTLNEQAMSHQAEVELLLTGLDDAAVKMTMQDRLLRNQQSLRQQIQRQEAFEMEILERLEQLSSIPPFSKVSMQVLQPAQVGAQVAPLLLPKLCIGAVTGSMVGAAIGLLLALATVMGNASKIAPAGEAKRTSDMIPAGG